MAQLEDTLENPTNYLASVLYSGGGSRGAKAARADPADAHSHGRIAVIETQSREPQSAMPDDLPLCGRLVDFK